MIERLLGQETEVSGVEAEYRDFLASYPPGCAQEGAVASDADGEIG